MQTFLIVAVSLSVFFWASRKIAARLALRKRHFHRPVMQRIDAQDAPDDERVLLAEGARVFQMLGFVEFAWFRLSELSEQQDQWQVVQVLWHPEHRTFAEIRVSGFPDRDLPLSFILETHYDEHWVVTGNEYAYVNADAIPALSVENRLVTHPRELINYHLERLKDADRLHGARRSPTPEQALALNEKQLAVQTDALLESGDIVQTSEGLQLTARLVGSMQEQVTQWISKRMELFPKPEDRAEDYPDSNYSAASVLTAEKIAAVRMLSDENPPLSPWIKAGLLILSGVACAMVFGMLFDPKFVVVLMGVLLFHELGHLLAMRAFGYRNLQVLFMPLGAMVTGRKDTATPLQQVLVYLAGPLPGILLAILLSSITPLSQGSELWVMTVVLLFVINLINLLPFPPLDGGQLLKKVLFNRGKLLAPLILDGLAVMIFVMVAWLADDGMLWVLAVIAGLVFAAQCFSFKSERLLLTDQPQFTDPHTAAHALIDRMADQPMMAIEKFGHVLSLTPQLMEPPATRTERATGLTLYLLALAGSVGWFILDGERSGYDRLKHAMFNEATMMSSADWPEAWDENYWIQALADAQTTEERLTLNLGAAEAMNEIELDDATHRFLDQGIALAEAQGLTDHPAYVDMILLSFQAPRWTDDANQVKTERLIKLRTTVLNTDPRLADALASLGQARDGGESLALFDEAIEIHQINQNRQGEAEVLRHRAYGLISLKRLDQAEEALRRLIAMDEYMARPWQLGSDQHMLGQLLARQGRFQAARNILIDLRAKSDDNANALSNGIDKIDMDLARLSILLADWPSAQAALNRVHQQRSAESGIVQQNVPKSMRNEVSQSYSLMAKPAMDERLAHLIIAWSAGDRGRAHDTLDEIIAYINQLPYQRTLDQWIGKREHVTDPPDLDTRISQLAREAINDLRPDLLE